MKTQRLDTTYAKKAYLLSHAEQRLFLALNSVFGRNVRLMAKVRLADVVSCATTYGGDFGRISQKHLDFVVVDPANSRILIAIELDDRSHLTFATRERDAFVNELLRSIGLPLVRIQAAASYNPHVLRQQISLAFELVDAGASFVSRPKRASRRVKSRVSRR